MPHHKRTQSPTPSGPATAPAMEERVSQLKDFVRGTYGPVTTSTKREGNIVTPQRYKARLRYMIDNLHQIRQTNHCMNMRGWCVKMVDHAACMYGFWDRPKPALPPDAEEDPAWWEPPPSPEERTTQDDYFAFVHSVLSSDYKRIGRKYIEPMYQHHYAGAPMWVFEAIALQAHQILEATQFYTDAQTAELAANYVIDHLSYDKKYPPPTHPDFDHPSADRYSVSAAALRYYAQRYRHYESHGAKAADQELLAASTCHLQWLFQ